MNNGRSFVIRRGDTLRHEFYPYLGDVSDVLDVWFTVKDEKDCPDEDAIIQISLQSGLIRIVGEAALTPANGSIALTADGRCSVFLDEVETAKLPTGYVWWDVQLLRDPDIIETPYITTLNIVSDITLATS